jgi:hypothetical protein
VSSIGKIDIICPIHKKFTQVAGKHLQGHGCRKCSRLIQGRAVNAIFA